MISETKRLDVVRKFNELDFKNNRELNDLVTLASEICQVPIAMITLMGEEIQWIKSVLGVDISENTRENSFCKHLINTNEAMVIPDTLADERFKNHPLVESEYGVRFYAGAPLITNDGYHLGSICVFDQTPQDFTDRQKQMLTILSKQVMNLLELEMNLLVVKNQQIEIANSESKIRAFFNSSSSCYLLLGKDFEILHFNKSVFNFFKQTSGKNIKNGKNFLNFINAGYEATFINDFKLAKSGKSVNREILVNYDNQTSIWWNILLDPVKNDEGEIFSISLNATNINEKKQHLAEITAQNESLLSIAYIQSHEYRRPVASILGLMNVIKEYDYEFDKDCLTMMESAVNELDEKINGVVLSVQSIVPNTAN
ncbi:hypothetical protein GCM10027049_06450 [Mucilaginibacter puniceus]